MCIWKSTLFVLVISILQIEESKSDTYVIYDTKTATSDLQWTLHPTYNGWEELSNLDVDGNTIRAYQVCNFDQPDQDNWARSPYIEAKSAQRIYIDIEYAVMKCEECRETFTLYYYPSSENVASSTFPPWRENPYIKLDTIAASERFDSDSVGPYGINKKTLIISRLQRKGFYIAVQDQGACMSLMSVKIYYHYCPEITQNLALFPRTVSGGEAASLVSVNGNCVENSVYVNNQGPEYRCNSNGEWTVPTGHCQCKAGYSNHLSKIACEACPADHYKPRLGNGPCLLCPLHSKADRPASSRCLCDPGFFKAEFESEANDCTRPPSAPLNLTHILNETKLLLNWLQPLSLGNRNDTFYSVTCQKCNQIFEECSSCAHDVSYSSMRHQHVTDTSIMISDLKPHSNYIFKVSSHNGVSSVSRNEASFSSIRVEMLGGLPPKVQNVTVVHKDHQSVTFQWPAVRTLNGQTSGYEVVYDVIDSKNVYGTGPKPPVLLQVTDCNITIADLIPGTEYGIQVRASSLTGNGPFSKPIIVKTDSIFDPSTGNLAGDDEQIAVIAGAAAGGILFAVIVFSVILWKRRRRRRERKNEEDRIRRKISDDSQHLLLGRNGFTKPAAGGSQRKTYVDYRDPHQGVKEVACEIEQSRITIERVIGQGEFGEVCYGKLKEGRKSFPVAIKRLRHEASLMDQTNFLREACTMAQFSHPHIIQFKGVVTKSIPAMIITEFMENGSLDQYLQEKQGELSMLQLLKMLHGIANGMNYLSQMNYIHRDLAARNILGGKIALRWSAPECIRHHRFTSASDVWSFGIVIWEVMSYGEKPYWDMTNEDVSHVIEDGYRLPAPLNCPQSLHNLMLLCWVYDENRRPKFDEILHKIGNFLLHPNTLTDEVEMIDISGSLLRASTSSTLPDVSNIDEWLKMVKSNAGDQNRSLVDFESLNSIKTSDLERLGVVTPDHRIRFQNDLNNLRQQVISGNRHSTSTNGSRPAAVFPSDLSSISSNSAASNLPSNKQPYLTEPALV